MAAYTLRRAQTPGSSNSRRQIYVSFAVTFYPALFPPVVNAPNKQKSQGAQMSNFAFSFAHGTRKLRGDLRSGLHILKRWTVVVGWVVLGFGFCSFIGLSAGAAALWVLGVLAI
jgi:hypothetical protein